MGFTVDNVSTHGLATYVAAASPSASTTSADTSGASASTPQAPTPTSSSTLSSDTLSALIAAQAEEIEYPPAPTPPPPPPGSFVPRTDTAAASRSSESKLADVLDAIRATPPTSAAPAADTSKPFSKRDSARTGVQTPGVSSSQAQTMNRIASGQAGIAILQVASVAAAFNAQFSASSFNNGFSTGLGGTSASRFSSNFAFQQNRLF